MRLGYGRRLLANIVKMGESQSLFNQDPVLMAYQLGLAQTAKDLNTKMRDVNGEAWLIMQREMLSEESDDQ